MKKLLIALMLITTPALAGGEAGGGLGCYDCGPPGPPQGPEEPVGPDEGTETTPEPGGETTPTPSGGLDAQ